MREIQLSKGFVATVDDADYRELARFKWHVKINKDKKYAVRNAPGGQRPRTIKMHRVILNAAIEELVDHRDGNGLNNGRENLRVSTPSGNQANRRCVLSQHGLKGVFYIGYTQNKGRRWQRRKPWHAKVTVGYKTLSLGYFATKEEAAAAYDVGARRLFAEFAATNADLGLL